MIGAVFAPLWLPCPGFVIHRVAASATCSLLLEINYMYIRVFGTRNCPKIRVFGTNSAVLESGCLVLENSPGSQNPVDENRPQKPVEHFAYQGRYRSILG